MVDRDGTVHTYTALASAAATWADRLGPTRRLVLVHPEPAADVVAAYLGALTGRHAVVLAGSPEAAHAIADVYDPDVVLAPGPDGVALTARRPGSAHELHPDLRLLLSTSGSTGSPKLVRLSETNLAANAGAIAEYLRLTPADRAHATLPLHYCYGLSVLHSHLAAGASVVLDDRSVVDPCFWQRFRASGATSFAGVPFTFELLDRVRFAEMDLPTLRFVTQAGGRLDPETVVRYARLGRAQGWELFVMYGQTEATARMAYLPPARAAEEPGSIGQPIPGGRFEIRAPDPAGVGELVYHGPNVMLGYAESPTDLARGATIDALATGDLARRAPSGHYEIVGRVARFLKIVGIRVDLDRLERRLADTGVRAACTRTDDLLVVAVEPGADPRAVSRFVVDTGGLPRGAVRVVTVDEIPRLASGKVDYRALVRLAVDTPEPAGEPAGDSVRALFAEVLDLDPDGIDDTDTFVDLGGDSLSYVEVSTALEEQGGRLPAAWHVQSVADLERALGPSRPTTPTLATDVVLRTVATLLILGTHAQLFRVQGGAHILLAVSGLNFARFVVDGERHSPLRQVAPLLRRIVVPTVACVAALAVIDPTAFGGWKLLLVHDYATGGRWRYWYVEALVQLCLVLAVVLSVPVVRRAERAHPFGVAMAFVLAGLVVRGAVTVGMVPGAVLQPHTLLWLFAVGWAAARATSVRQRMLVTGAALLGLAGFFPDNLSRTTIVLAGVVTLIWSPRLPIPRVVHRPVAAVAAASLYVYLLQFEVYPPLLEVLPVLVVVPLTVLVGIGVHRLVQPRARERSRRSRRSLRRGRVQVGQLAGARVP